MEFVGESIGPYLVEARLGSGGMGEVFRALGEDGLPVALKVLHPHLVAVRGAFQRFQREAELGRTITHPNVVRTLGADEVDLSGQKVHYLVMEYVEGQTLQELLVELEHLPEELCRHVGIQITDALTAIHALAAVHRDIKPANVIITPDHHIKVMDFGVSRLSGATLQLSEVGEFLGSVLYAAPEQWDPEAEVDGRADLFALGILLYEVSTGRHPFAGREGTTPLSALATGEVEPASATNPELSPFLVELISALLRPDPAQRFSTAALVRDVLETGEQSAWWQDRSRELELSGRGRVRRLEVPRMSRVFGREAELEQLRTALEEARGGRGQVVMIEGESGIGKTRLVDEFVRTQEGEFEFLFGAYPPGGAPPSSGALSTAFREHLGHAQLDQRLADLMPETPGLVDPFAALLRGTGDVEGPGRLAEDSISTAFVATAKGLAREKPLVLFLDNLDFAPREARAIFGALAHAIRTDPVLLVAAFRPRTTGDSMARVRTLEYASRIELQRLGAQDLTDLLADALGSSSLAHQLGWEIARKSDGNPFFVFEILRDLRIRGRLMVDESGSWRTTGLIREIETPHSLRDLIRLRLKQLPVEDRDLLDLAACCGPRFDPSLVAAAAGAPLVPTLKRFRCLERDHGLVRPDGREYVFDHHQMQEAIYSDLFEQLREQYHFAVGEAMESRWAEPSGPQAIELCRHFLYGQSPQRASPHLLPALRELYGGHMVEQVEELASKAVETGVVMEPYERFMVLGLLAGSAALTGNWKAQESAAVEMGEIAESLDDDELRVDALMALGLQRYSVASCEDSIRLYSEALEIATRHDLRDKLEGIERGLGISYSRQGMRQQALAHHHRSLALSEELGMESAAAAAHNNIAIQLVNENETDEAERHYLRAIELAQASGATRWEANAHANYGRIFFQRGDYARAWEHVLRYRELTRLIGDRRGEATSGVILCALWSIFGAIEEIEHELARVAVEAEETRDRWLSGFVAHRRAWLAEQAGDFDGARAMLVEATQLRREINDREGIAVLLYENAAVAAAQGDREAAIALLEESLAIDEAEPDTRATALCELAVLQPERVEEATRALESQSTNAPVMVHGSWCLWRATGDRAHLERAHGNLETVIANVPPEYRTSARTRSRINRAVIEAWTKTRA